MKWILFLLVVIVVGYYLPHDDSDPVNGRSGLGVYTDNLTGCQYLATLFGSPTPRMDRNGKQVCK